MCQDNVTVTPGTPDNTFALEVDGVRQTWTMPWSMRSELADNDVFSQLFRYLSDLRSQGTQVDVVVYEGAPLFLGFIDRLAHTIADALGYDVPLTLYP